jgi:hypothetical protein
MSLLKWLFWVYFLLLIFEGALRKWILPQFSAPLLLVRDPVSLLIIWEAYRTQKWPKRWSSVAGVLASAILVLAVLQVVVAENPWFVAIYGLRSFLLPFPVAFIMGENLDAEDLRKFGRWILFLLLPEVILEAAQYLAPATSFLNKGAYKGMEQIGSAGGHLRASGTFSFAHGSSAFVSLAAVFVLYAMVDRKFVPRWLLWASSLALIVAIPVIASRGLVVNLLLLLAFVVLAALFSVSQFAQTIKIILALLFVSLAATQLPVFSSAMGTFTERLSTASESEGGTEGTLNRRIASPLQTMLTFDYESAPWYGNGLGMGSNVASTLLIGTQVFLAGEGEVSRLLFEFGPFAGFAFLFFRLGLGLFLTARAFVLLIDGRSLAWLLVPGMFVSVLLSTLEQPTLQGFVVISLAFCIAATRSSDTPLPDANSVPTPRPTRLRLKPAVRGDRVRPGIR